jgi:hypothetical protein
MGYLVQSVRTTKPPAAPDDRSPATTPLAQIDSALPETGYGAGGRRPDEPILRTEPDGDQQVSDGKWLRASWPEAELVTHQCALRPRDLYVYLRLQRRQPITNFNCSQPLERPANRPQDQIPERAGPRGWRTGVTAGSPQPRSSP